MPFDTQPRERNIATGRACRAVVAARLLDPATELPAFRALQLARFTTTTLFDTDDGIRAALAGADGLDADAIVAAIDAPATEEAYQADRALVRTAAGSPTEFQGKAANSDGAVRYTAPSLIFTHRDGRSLEAGGFQTAEAYDVIIANLDADARPAPAGRGRHRGAGRPAVRADDPRGRRDDGPAPGRAGRARRRGGADRRRGERVPCGARTSAAERCGGRRDRVPAHDQREGRAHGRGRRRGHGAGRAARAGALARDPARLRVLGTRPDRPAAVAAGGAGEPRDRAAARRAARGRRPAEALRPGDGRGDHDRRRGRVPRRARAPPSPCCSSRSWSPRRSSRSSPTAPAARSSRC